MRDEAQNGRMNETNRPTTEVEHSPDCNRPGMRYGATVRRTQATIANGTAGRVLMLCRNGHCPARRYV